MIEKPLSTREKKVLCASLCYPQMKEKDIARMLKLNQSTYNVIKRRLRKRKLYQKVRAPCLFNMGFELFCVVHADISPFLELDVERLKKLFEGMQIGAFSFLSRRHLIAMGFVQNYSSAVREHVALKEFLRKMSGIDVVKTTMHIFPREYSVILNFFNLGPSLADLWGLEKYKKKPEKVCGMEWRKKAPKLSSMGWKVLGALLKYPSLNDSRIAEHLKTSRQVVNKYKKTFEEEGYITTLGLTDPLRLGLNVLSARWIKFVDKGKGSILERMGEVCFEASQQFMVMGPEEIFTLSVYPDLTTLEVDEFTFLKALKEKDILPFEMNHSIISLQDSTQPTFFNFERATDILQKESQI